jgi:hypothetical protein
VWLGSSQNTNVTLRVSSGGKVTGTVRTAQGAILSSAEVDARINGSTDSLQQFTDAAGRYRFTGLKAGTYTVTARTSGYGPVDAQAIISGTNTVTLDYSLPPYVAPANLGTISWTVRDTLGKPVTANVRLVDSNGRQQQSSASSLTVPAGTYFAVAGQSFASRGDRVAPAMGIVFDSRPCVSPCSPVTGTPINVSGGSTTNIGFTFPLHTASISGTVIPSASVPQLTHIQLYEGDTLIDESSYLNLYTGQYSFSGLFPGTYRVYVEADGYVPAWYGDSCAPCGGRGAPIVVDEGADVSGINVNLVDVASGGSIAGRLTMIGASYGVTVQALDATGAVIASTVSGGPTYTITGLPAGSYYVRTYGGQYLADVGSGPAVFPDQIYPGVPCHGVDCPLEGGTPITVAPGATTPSVDFTLRRGAQLIPTLISEGPAIGIDGRSSPSSGYGGDVDVFDSVGRRSGRTSVLDSTVAALDPGTYYVRTHVDKNKGYADVLYGGLTCAACPPELGTPITLQEGEVREITLALLRAGSIEGTVTTSNAAAAPNVTVTAYTSTGIAANAAVTDSDGHYSIGGLGPGAYTIGTKNVAGYLDVLYPNVPCLACDPSSGPTVSVTGGVTVSGVDVTLGNTGARITGRVTDGRGSALSEQVLDLFDGRGAGVGRATTDADGIFVATVPPATTYARAEPGGTFAPQRYFHLGCTAPSCDPTQGIPIIPAAGALTSNVDFDLPQCPRMGIAPFSLQPSSVGRYVAVPMTLVYGNPPFAFMQDGGTLPPGLTLASNGALSGTPSQMGRYTWTVAATDAIGCGATRTFTLDVLPCTPSLADTSPLADTIDVSGSSTHVSIALASTSCLPSPLSAVGWVNAHLNGSSVELDIGANSGTRRSGTVSIGGRVITINQGLTVTSAPFGSLDTPPSGAVVSGSIAVSGWALDDLRVTQVAIYRDPDQSEGSAQVFIGYATFVPGARPDVVEQYATLPYADRAGWGYMLLTNMLPRQGNGTFTLYAYADDVDGHRTLLGTRTFVAANATATRPFGAIDTPAQGETIGGATGSTYVNFGWALTPWPKAISTDGSTVHVFVDGADIGNVDYNHYRADIATLFPGFANSGGAVGFHTIDLSTLVEGLHTIAWSVTDNGGVTEGIGSRYFSVTTQTVASARAQLSAARAAVIVAPPAPAAEVVLRVIQSHQLDRIRIEPAEWGAACATTWTGRQRASSGYRALPVGSRLDSATGVFTWQPGPAFQGDFDIELTASGCAEGPRRLELRVRIVP